MIILPPNVFNRSVDLNDEYDNVTQEEQDCQDSYFDNEKPSMIESTDAVKSKDVSDDELDIYMKEISSELK